MIEDLLHEIMEENREVFDDIKFDLRSSKNVKGNCSP